MAVQPNLKEILYAAVDSETGADVGYNGDSLEEYCKFVDNKDGVTGFGQLIEFAAVFGKVGDSEERICHPFEKDSGLCEGQPADRSLINTDDLFAARVRPRSPIPHETSVAHGIRDEDLVDHPFFEDHFRRFVEEIEGYVLLIHNAAYDWPVFKWHAEQIGVELKPFAVIDTFRLARLVLPEQRYHSNQYLMHQFKIPRLRGHLAAPDAAVTLMVFKHLLAIYLSEAEDDSLEGLCKVLSKPIPRKIWPFGKHKGQLIEEVPPSYWDWWFEKRIIDDYANEDWELSYWAAVCLDGYNKGRTSHVEKCLGEFNKRLAWPCFD
jgi:DNA polymerase III epsilon subunit-like protein